MAMYGATMQDRIAIDHSSLHYPSFLDLGNLVVGAQPKCVHMCTSLCMSATCVGLAHRSMVVSTAACVSYNARW